MEKTKNIIRSEVAKRLHKENPNFAMKGKHHSEIVKEKIRVSNIGKKHKPLSEEAKLKIGLLTKGKSYEERYGYEKSIRVREKLSKPKSNTSNMKGFCGHHSNEAKKKISIAGKGRKPPITGKKHTEKSKLKMKMTRLKRINEGKITVWNRGKTGIYSQETLQKIREARKQQIFPIKDTKIEVRIQDFLESLNIEFYTHKYISEITHSYQCDIFIPVQEGINKKTIIECDGNYWHNYPTGTEIDHTRTHELSEKGYRVIRLWETEIYNLNKEQLKQKIWN